MKKKEYHKGDILNKETQVVFIEELSPDSSNHRRVRALCKKDNNFFVGRLDRIIHNNQVCPECQSKRRIKKHYFSGQILNRETKTVLLYLTERDKKGNQYGLVRCGICGHEYETKLSIVEKGSKCRECRQKAIKESVTVYTAGDIINSKKGRRYLFLKELKPVVFKSRVTRYGLFVLLDDDNKPLSLPFREQLGHILQGNYTGNGRSFGELMMQQSLLKLGVEYQKEYSFSDLYRYKGKPLRFDFAVFLNNKIVLFELDGDQHHESCTFFGGEQGLKDIQERDNMKEKYVASHENLFLIRIPYKNYSKISKEYIKLLLEEVENFG